MPVQLTMMFQATQSKRAVGWSESIIYSSNSLDQAQERLFAQNNYVKLRLACLGAGVENIYSRLTLVPDPNAPQAQQLRVVLGLAGVPAPLSTGGVPSYNQRLKGDLADFGQSVFMLRMQSAFTATPVYVRTWWIAGFPDVGQQIDQARPMPGAWTTAMDALKTLLKNGSFLFRALDRSSGNALKPCSAYTPVNNTYTVNAHGFTTGQQVAAYGWRGEAGASVPKGRYKVTAVDNNTIFLQGTEEAGPFAQLGSFRLVKYTYPVIANVTERGFTNKKKGRPFGELAGRRRIPTRLRA